MPLIYTLVAFASLFTVIILVFVTLFLAYRKFKGLWLRYTVRLIVDNYHYFVVCKGKIFNDSPEVSLSLSDENYQGIHYQTCDNVVLQEQGIYSLLQAEESNQVNSMQIHSIFGIT